MDERSGQVTEREGGRAGGREREREREKDEEKNGFCDRRPKETDESY